MLARSTIQKIISSNVALAARKKTSFAVEAVGGLAGDDGAECGVDALVGSECSLVLAGRAVEVEACTRVTTDTGLVVGFAVETVGGLAGDDGAECGVDALVGSECSLVLAGRAVEVEACTRVTTDTGLVVGFAVETVGGLAGDDGAECGVDALVGSECSLVLAGRAVEVEACTRVTTDTGLVVGFAVETVGGLAGDDGAECGVDALVGSECSLVLAGGAVEVEACTRVTTDTGLVVGFAVETVGGLAGDDGAECGVDALVGSECSLVLACGPVEEIPSSGVAADPGHVVGFAVETVGGLAGDDGAECGVDALVGSECSLVLACGPVEEIPSSGVAADAG